jgi:hypothetical protein
MKNVARGTHGIHRKSRGEREKGCGGETIFFTPSPLHPLTPSLFPRFGVFRVFGGKNLWEKPEGL